MYIYITWLVWLASFFLPTMDKRFFIQAKNTLYSISLIKKLKEIWLRIKLSNRIEFCLYCYTFTLFYHFVVPFGWKKLKPTINQTF